MHRAAVIVSALALGTLTSFASAATCAATPEEAHGAYLDAINSNDLDTFMGMLTPDIAYQAPNSPELVGTTALHDWAKDYLDNSTTVWDKTVLELIPLGDWAFERSTYKETDAAKADGKVTTDQGKAMLLYHKDEGGCWRVARDGWSSDQPLQ